MAATASLPQLRPPLPAVTRPGPRLRPVSSPTVILLANGNASGIVRHPELVDGARSLLRTAGARVETQVTSSIEEARRDRERGRSPSYPARRRRLAARRRQRLRPEARAGDPARRSREQRRAQPRRACRDRPRGQPRGRRRAAPGRPDRRAHPDQPLSRPRRGQRRLPRSRPLELPRHELRRLRAGIKAGLARSPGTSRSPSGSRSTVPSRSPASANSSQPTCRSSGSAFSSPRSRPGGRFARPRHARVAGRRLLSLIPHLRRGTHIGLPGVRHVRARRIRIATGGRSPIIADTTTLDSHTVELTVGRQRSSSSERPGESSPPRASCTRRSWSRSPPPRSPRAWAGRSRPPTCPCCSRRSTTSPA